MIELASVFYKYRMKTNEAVFFNNAGKLCYLVYDEGFWIEIKISSSPVLVVHNDFYAVNNYCRLSSKSTELPLVIFDVYQ